ncbi:MAG: hypothetical protein JW971_05410, partial [Synergistales bacterium]|nr:hypothetical protein [Synergistales bacterium]
IHCNFNKLRFREIKIKDSYWLFDSKEKLNMDVRPEMIINTATQGLTLQNEDGSMPPGVNGPHSHVMTGARTTSHWAITFLLAFSYTKTNLFAEAGEKCLKVLLSPKYRPRTGSFWHRQHPGKNEYNGLIGQAWTMESLLYGYALLKEEVFLRTCREVFLLHKFNQDLGLWHCLGIQGNTEPIEYTLNQQIWMAAIGSLLSEHYPEMEEYPLLFLDKLSTYLMVNPTGYISLGISYHSLLQRIKQKIKKPFLQQGITTLQDEKTVGYHVFSLCGLAIIFRHFPQHTFWECSQLQTALELIFTTKYENDISTNMFGYPYNVVGFEIPYILYSFNNIMPYEESHELSRKVLAKQIHDHYDPENSMLNRNTMDPITLASRFYEVYRFLAPEITNNDLEYGR